jgi:ribosomal protein S1
MPTNFANPILGNIVQGTVISITKNFAAVDINWRENAIIDLKKEKAQYLQYIMPGYPIEVQIERIETSVNGTSKGIYASYSSLITSKFKNELIESVEKNIAYLGKVVELVHAGYFVDIKGVKCFMPGSLGGMNKLVDFSVLLNKDIYVVPVNYSKEKDYVVVSHRDYLKALVPGKVNELEIGQEYEGAVTGYNTHGIFVEFNECLTGLISRLDMSPEYIVLYENGSIKPGDAIKFKLKKIISNEKLSLTQNEIETESSKWATAKAKYKVNSYAIGTIKRILPYGAFIELEEGIVGLLHKSNIKDGSELEVSQEIKVKVLLFDADNKKIILDV